MKQVKHRYINGIDLFILEQENSKKLCSRYSGREQELPKNFPAILDGNGKQKKVISLFVNRNLRHSRWEIYGNGKSHSCLMCIADSTTISLSPYHSSSTFYASLVSVIPTIRFLLLTATCLPAEGSPAPLFAHLLSSTLGSLV